MSYHLGKETAIQLKQRQGRVNYKRNEGPSHDSYQTSRSLRSPVQVVIALRDGKKNSARGQQRPISRASLLEK